MIDLGNLWYSLRNILIGTFTSIITSTTAASPVDPAEVVERGTDTIELLTTISRFVSIGSGLFAILASLFAMRFYIESRRNRKKEKKE